MKMRFGHLADFSGLGENGKLLIVGIFDVVFDAMQVRPIPLMSRCYLVGSFEAHLSEGTQHTIGFRMVGPDNVEVFPLVQGPITFVSQGPGRPCIANLIAELNGLTVPDLGDYRFEFYLGTRFLGKVSLFVVPPPGRG